MVMRVLGLWPCCHMAGDVTYEDGTQFGDLTDNSYLCSRNCGFGHN